MSNVETQLTIIMAVHNGSPFLRTAIDSILNQTYPNFNFLIIDDASTDDTREIVRSYTDARITLECLYQNVGQTAALNIGLNLASTPWIGRLDADDYSAPNRFEEQMRALEADSTISCIGTHVWMFHDDPKIIDSVLETPEHHSEIRKGILRGSSMVHGSIVIDRKALLDIGGFNERYRLVADLELYDRFVVKYQTANIPMQLVGIRQHTDQTSGTKLAFDEVIDICSRRIESNSYTPEETSIIRSTLSRAYLYRARCVEKGNNIGERLKYLGRAIRVSPSTFIWNSCLVFVFNRLSDQHRSILRRLLSGFRVRFLTGR